MEITVHAVQITGTSRMRRWWPRAISISGQPVESYAINNWELAPLVHITSGAPLNVTCRSGQLADRCWQRSAEPGAGREPVPQDNLQKGKWRGKPAISESRCFRAGNCSVRQQSERLPILGTFGNIRRNSFRTPPFLQFDSQISRIFPIHESLAMTLRLEAFNVLNHPDFSGGLPGRQPEPYLVNLWASGTNCFWERRPRIPGKREGFVLRSRASPSALPALYADR